MLSSTDHQSPRETMRLLTEADIDRMASVNVAVAAAEDAARLAAADGVLTGRVQVEGATGWMRILVGMIPDLDLLGYKEFHRVGRHVRYYIHLFRQSTGEPLGIVDGRRITSLRTAATAAVAARRYLGDRKVRVAVIGSGEEAKEGLRALADTIRIRDVAVYSPTESNRRAFATIASRELDLVIREKPTVGDCVTGAEVAYVATSSRDSPFLTREHARHLHLILAVGATRPEHHELSGDVFAFAERVVLDTKDALHESGDLREALRQTPFDDDQVVLLGQYLHESTRDPGLRHTVFKSIGSVEQDLVLASRLMTMATRNEAGYETPSIASLRVMR